MVTVLTQDDCQPCKATIRFLVKNSIPYQEQDVRQMPREEVQRYIDQGYTSTPIVLAPTGETWSGYRPDLLKPLASTL